MNSIHDQRVNDMKKKPYLIGLEDIALSTGEVILFDKGQVRREPDGLMFDEVRKKIYNIEYKSGGNLKKAREQLIDTRYLLNRIFPEWTIINLYVHDFYKVQKLR